MGKLCVKRSLAGIRTPMKTQKSVAEDGLDSPDDGHRGPAPPKSPDLVWFKDARGVYLSCNRAFEHYLGAVESSIIGRTDRDFAEKPPADPAGGDDPTAMAASGPITNEEWLTFAQDGYHGLFQTIKTAVRDSSGALVGVMGVARDITELREAESRLLASELRYRRLFESAKDGILILDAGSGLVVDVNPYLIERLGFSREHFLGKKIWELGPFKDIIASHANFVELQQNEYIRYEDKPLQTFDGRRIDVEFVSNVYLVNGEKVVQCNIRDITARKAAERLLREQNEILANAHEGVVILNLANEVTLWNPAAERIFGWTAAEAIGRPPGPLLGAEDPAQLAMIHLAVERDGFWNGELPVRARDGRKLVVDCRITLVRDEAGRPRARLKFFADITEKKLFEKQLLRVQRLEAIGTLSSGISHDLNNMLTPILMASGLLREKLLDSRDRDLMGLIEKSARRGAEIIRQLLAFSRGLEGERVNLQTRHLIKEMAGIVRETFPRNITLVEGVERDLWPIVADATQLHQVLMNLCINARDAMPEGGILTIAAKNVRLTKHDSQLGANALDGPYVFLTVRDTGHGIPRELIDRIFEPFFTTKAVGQGTGLGLSTVLGIVRSHGGFVTAYSEPGQGSSFNVYLPAVIDGCVAPPADEAEALADGGGEMILVVDDEAAIVAAVRLCLEGRGYRVLTAKDGREALELYAAHRAEVRVVLTDVMMPVMDGLKLARALRQLDAHVRVIASSGLDPAAIPAEVAAGFITEFLSKPYDQRLLLAAIQRPQKGAVPDKK